MQLKLPSWNTLLAKPFTILPLVYFRILFGIFVFIDTISRLHPSYDFVGAVTKTALTIKYPLFPWIQPASEPVMYLIVIATAIAGVFMSIGLLYRFSSIFAFIGYSYIFFIDKTLYSNQSYLILLLLLIHCFLSSGHFLALDNLLFKKKVLEYVPMWQINILRFMYAVVYIFAAITKIRTDWLISGQPMRLWMQASPIFGSVSALALLFSWGIFVLEIVAIPMLLHKRWRWLAILGLVTFHLSSILVFDLGVFPWLMLAGYPLFFAQNDWFKLTQHLNSHLTNWQLPTALAPNAAQYRLSKMSLLLIGGFFMWQVILPFHFLLYPGDSAWTRQGSYFSWQLKIANYDNGGDMWLIDTNLKTSETVNLEKYLHPTQLKTFWTDPDNVVQMANFLNSQFNVPKKKYSIRAANWSKFNGRKAQLLFPPELELNTLESSLANKSWLNLNY